MVAFVAELMFTMRIAKVVEHIGYDVGWVESAVQLVSQSERVAPEFIGEQLHGHEGRLFEEIVRIQPALMLFDLNNADIPWREWIALLKSAAATRRIPIMGFGPPEDVDAMTSDRSAGAEVVSGPPRFTPEKPWPL